MWRPLLSHFFKLLAQQKFVKVKVIVIVLAGIGVFSLQNTLTKCGHLKP